MRATTKKTVLASTTGALALSLLLAGCTGGGSDSGSDGSSGSAEGGSTSEASTEATPEPTGELALPASCDEVGARMGDLVDGLELTAQSTISDTEAECTWSTPEGDATGFAQVLFYAEAGAEGAAGIDSFTDGSLQGATVEELEDDRVDAVDGRAYSASAERDGATGALLGVATDQAGVGVGSIRVGGAATPDELLDIAFEFID